MREQEIPEGYSIAVLHTHTSKSDGMVTPTQLVEAAAKKQVRVLAITDHDTMTGIKEAEKEGIRLGVDILAGEEITSGLFKPKHIIGLFLEKPVPCLKNPEWTIEEIKKQGGLVVIPHPLLGFASLDENEIKRLAKANLIDGIEIINGNTNPWQMYRLHLLTRVTKNKVGAFLGASDCHFGDKDILTAYTLFPGKDLNDFFKAIKEKTTKPKKGPNASIPKMEKIKQHLKANMVLGIRRYLLRNLR